jgi:hypothetical protein
LPVKACLLLLALHEADGVVVRREKLLDRCWGEGRGSDEALTQTVAYLRRTIEQLNGDPESLVTYPKRGYALKSVKGLPARAEPSSGPRRMRLQWPWIAGLVLASLLLLWATHPHLIRHLIRHGLGLKAPPQ